tara:strand:- start:59 stop:520 length:462 start_codon:yes stop_codon:yes gene_type:complete
MFENNVVSPEKKQYLWKNGNHTFTIYRHNPKLINVTGLKSAEEIEQQKCLMEEKFKQKMVKVRIDNTFFSKKDYKNIDMVALYHTMKENKDYYVNYHVELFAGMYLHPTNKLFPTILVFRTGSYTLMGGKSLEVVKESQQFIQDLIEMFQKNV